MNLTLAGKGSVDTPDIVTLDEAHALLDSFGTGGRAINIPKQVDVQVFFARAPGTFYYDDPSLSGSRGGPESTITYYTVLNGGILGNRTIFANTHGNRFYIGEIFGDVFRGWNTFTQPEWVTQQIALAISNHESSRNHPYATENLPGFIQIAKGTESASRTENTKGMTSLRTQSLLDTYGIGRNAIKPPTGTDLSQFFQTQTFGLFHFDDPRQYVNAIPGSSWFDVICVSYGTGNLRSLIAVDQLGDMYTATLLVGVFSGWGKKLEAKDLPIASVTQQGIVQLEDSVTSTSLTKAATPNSVKSANDNANTRVPQTRTVNGKALSTDIVLAAADVGSYTTSQVDNLVNLRVPQTRTVNGKALSANIWLSAADVGAATPADVTNTIRQYGVSIVDSGLYGVGTNNVYIPTAASRIMISGFAQTVLMAVQATVTISININGYQYTRIKRGSRGGSSGHQYNSTFYIHLDEILGMQLSAGQTIPVSISSSGAQLESCRIIMTLYNV